MAIYVPITSSHLDVNGLIKKSRLSLLHLFPIYSCQSTVQALSVGFSAAAGAQKLLAVHFKQCTLACIYPIIM